MPIQEEYVENIRAPSPGTLSGSGETIDSFTGNCEPETGIPFGRAVSTGTVADYGDNAVILGGAIAIFRGVSIKDIGAKGADGNSYARYDNVGVLRRGLIWLEPAVAVTAGDPVHYDQTTGIFSNTGGQGPVKGARWETSCELNGRAMAFFAGLERQAAV